MGEIVDFPSTYFIEAYITLYYIIIKLKKKYLNSAGAHERSSQFCSSVPPGQSLILSHLQCKGTQDPS